TLHGLLEAGTERLVFLLARLRQSVPLGAGGRDLLRRVVVATERLDALAEGEPHRAKRRLALGLRAALGFLPFPRSPRRARVTQEGVEAFQRGLVYRKAFFRLQLLPLLLG